MPRDASGNYTLPVSNPVVSNTPIQSTGWANPTMADLGNEITNSLDRGGRGGMTGPFSIADGTLAAPGLRFTADPDNGLYRSTVNAWSMVAAGASVANLTAATFTIPAGVTFNMLGTPLGLGVAVQDAIPSPFKQGGQWWESDTGAYLMRYVNPDLTETLVALGQSGGDFIPYPLRGVANGVASLDAGTKVPIAQLPAGTANGVASLDAGGKVPVAQLPSAPTRQIFLTGSGTYTKPAGCRAIDVQLIGAGGSGAGGGGTAGNAVIGSATTFGPMTGGAGGPGGASNASTSIGGAATGGDINIQGAPGQGANGTVNIYGGRGGSSLFGSGGVQSSNTHAYGAGGDGGASAGPNTGGGGAAGGYCRLLISAPAATYSYSVGAPGSVGIGTASLGAQGGFGIIIVDEFY